MAVISITEQLDNARACLTPPEVRERSLPAVGAALLAAVTSLILAAAVVLGPGVESAAPPAQSAPDAA
ncbi:MAG: hypothetical protein K1X35_01525 [Caulobacteraceae bacterium]|nr:hypothetical protein [Caulobacteraceae bacterium]